MIPKALLFIGGFLLLFSPAEAQEKIAIIWFSGSAFYAGLRSSNPNAGDDRRGPKNPLPSLSNRPDYCAYRKGCCFARGNGQPPV